MKLAKGKSVNVRLEFSAVKIVYTPRVMVGPGSV
jgi:hypothetical protein